MGKPTGFMEYQRVEAPHRVPTNIVGDFSEFHEVYDVDTLQQQAARCMDCGIPFCHAGIELEGETVGCPLGNVIPEINDLVYRGLYDEAYARLRRTHPFPEFTSRVCPALCEGSCTLGEHQQAVCVKEIEHFLDTYAQDRGVHSPPTPISATGRKVAVVGSGPAGLAAADALNRLGEQVTVFERADRPGGLLMYGIPAMKLDKQLVLARIAQLEQEGICFVCNTEVGVDLTADKLSEDFDAVILACGATRALQTPAKGADLNGVILAMDYLTQATRQLLDSEHMFDSSLNACDKEVIVIGAGDTGTDCVATALRQGARSIAQFQRSAKPSLERLPSNPWPLWPRTLSTDYGHLEAVATFGNDPREFGISVKEILGDERGCVRGVITVEYETTYVNGQKILTERPNSEQQRRADMVLIAMGFAGPEPTVIDAFQLLTDERGQITTDETRIYGTSKPGIFAIGDMRRGQSLVVWALMEGRDVASEVHRYLNEQEKYRTEV